MNSFNISDIILIAFLALCVYFYYHKGLIMTIYGFCTTVFSLVLSRFLSPFFAGFLKNTAVFENIKESIAAYISESTLSDSTASITESLSIPDFLKSSIESGIDTTNALSNDFISSYITNFIIDVIAMMIIFILIFTAFKVLANVLKVFSHLPVIRTANHIGGGVLGFIQGVIVIWIVFAVFTAFCGSPVFNSINESISNSLIASRFYDSNVLIKGFSAIK